MSEKTAKDARYDAIEKACQAVVLFGTPDWDKDDHDRWKALTDGQSPNQRGLLYTAKLALAMPSRCPRRQRNETQ